MADLLDELLGAVGLKNEELKKTSSTLKDIFGVQVQEQRVQAEQQAIADEKSIEVLRAKEVAGLQAQNNARSIAASLGTNMDESSQVLTSLATDYRAAAVDAAEKNKELSRAVSSKFLDNPIQFIKDQLFLESTEAEAKVATQRANASAATLSNLQSLTQNAAVSQNSIAATRTDASVQAAMEGLAAESGAKAAAQRIQNAGINFRGIQSLQEMSLQEINLRSTAYNASRQEAQFKLAQENAAFQRENQALLRQERLDRVEQKQADRAEEEDLANLVRAGAAVFGYKDVNAFPTNKILQLLKLKDPKVSQYLTAGMKTAAIGYPVVSENVGEAAQQIAVSGAPLRPEQENVKRFLQSMWQEGVTANPGAKQDFIVAQVSKFASSTAAMQAKHIKPGDASNIYSPPALPTVLAIPAISASPLYQGVFKEQMQTGVLKEFNPDQLIEMTVAGIRAGKVSINDASEGLQGIFNGAKEVNNRSKNYPGFGLPLQKGYNTTVTSGLGFSRAYDLTQKQAIDQILNSKLSKFQEAARPFIENQPFGLR